MQFICFTSTKILKELSVQRDSLNEKQFTACQAWQKFITLVICPVKACFHLFQPKNVVNAKPM